MKKDKHKTEVIFRKFKDNGDIIAIFPYIVGFRGEVQFYMHVGQHGDSDYCGLLSRTKLATPKEYIALKRELRSIGYNIKVIQKRNYNKYVEAYRELNNY